MKASLLILVDLLRPQKRIKQIARFGNVIGCDPMQNPDTLSILGRIPFTYNQYTFSQVIGHGNFSIVLLAHDNNFNRDFAAKFIPLKGQSETLDAELQILCRLSHSNIIKLYNSFTYSSHLVLIFQYCSLGSLKAILDTIPMSPVRVHSYIHQILTALKHSHKKHVVHRDIKPANILFDSIEHPLLADFGLSAFFDESQTSNEFYGSIQYRSPEIILKHAHDPFKSDVWSLGVLFYTMAVGKEPWPTYSYEALKEAIISADYSIPLSVDPLLSDLICQMLNPNPDERPNVSSLLDHVAFNNTIYRSPLVLSTEAIHGVKLSKGSSRRLRAAPAQRSLVLRGHLVTRPQLSYEHFFG